MQLQSREVEAFEALTLTACHRDHNTAIQRLEAMDHLSAGPIASSPYGNPTPHLLSVKQMRKFEQPKFCL